MRCALAQLFCIDRMWQGDPHSKFGDVVPDYQKMATQDS